DRRDRHRAIRQNAGAGVVVEHEARNRFPELLLQAFVTNEVEQLIALKRPTEGAAVLVAPEVGLPGRVEIVGRVQSVVAMEFEEASVYGVGSRLGEHSDLAAVVAAELGAVGIR